MSISSVRTTTNIPPPQGITQDAYTFLTMMRQLENLEHDRLVFVPTLPNIGHFGHALWLVSLPRDTLKFI